MSRISQQKHIISHQGNARPRGSLMTRQNLSQPGWEGLLHPPYSPDITPLDFHLFRSLQSSLNRKKFNSLEDYKRHLEKFFAQKDKKFGKMELWSCLKDGRRQWNKMVNTLMKLLVKKMSFYFKIKWTFWVTQYLFIYLLTYLLVPLGTSKK